MKSRVIPVLSMLAALAITLQLTAQDNLHHKSKHHQYKLYDVGTFGGPQSLGSTFAVSLTPAGGIGTSDTPTPDPFSPNCIADCFVKHAVLWQRRAVTDLGALPGNNGGNSSYAYAINNAGLVVGISENGAVDPATGYPEVHAVAWQHGTTVDLGTFGGAQSAANMVNNRGQVVGNALNTVPDPYSFGSTFPATTQSRAVLWDRGMMRDLGTLGGPDASAYIISQSGKIAGTSYTNDIPNPTTGIPTIHPFLWDNGKMIDLGSFGGTLANVWDLNNQGQVVGYSFLAGDQSWRGFLWDHGMLINTGSLGGHGSYLGWINEAGVAVGGSFLADEQTVHATLRRQGKLSDIGTVGRDTCAQAYGINSSQQVVGISNATCAVFGSGPGFLWENGGPMVDLNALVENPSDLFVSWGLYISDSGEIIGEARLPNGDVHLVGLVPDGDCEDDCEQRIADSQRIAVGQPATTGATVPAFGRPADWLRNPFGRRFPMPSQPALPAN